MAAMTRPYNLSAGPAILPPEVFERTAAAVRELALPGDDALALRPFLRLSPCRC